MPSCGRSDIRDMRPGRGLRALRDAWSAVASSRVRQRSPSTSAAPKNANFRVESEDGSAAVDFQQVPHGSTPSSPGLLRVFARAFSIVAHHNVWCHTQVQVLFRLSRECERQILTVPHHIFK